MRRCFIPIGLSLILLSLALGGCGGSGSGSNLANGTAPDTSAFAELPPAISAELQAAAPPDGVAPELWDELVSELARSLAERDTSKAVQAPPVGAQNMVSDLHILDDAGGMFLSWTYQCAGDYTRDGLVTVSDLTPVGIYYDATAGSLNWTQAQAADGDGNGRITVSDITPIGQNYGAATLMYNVYASDDVADYPANATAPSGPGTRYLTSAIFAEQPVDPAGRRRFTAVVDAPVPGEYYWVRPSDGTTSGAPSNMTGRNLRGDWWMLGREPAHGGQSPFFASRTNDVIWEYDAGCEIHTAPAIRADGVLYIGCHDGLHAVNTDGSGAWIFPTTDIVEGDPAIGTDGTVYFGCWDGFFYAVNPDGTQRWRFTTDGSAFFTPAIGADDTVFVGCNDDSLYAILPDMTVAWSYPTGAGIHAGPTVGPDGTVYVGSYDDLFYAINADGTARWNFPTGDNIWGSAAVGSDGTVFFGSYDGFLYALNADGTERWRHRMDGPVQAGPAIGPDGTVFSSSGSYYLHAFTADGTLRWESLPAELGATHPAVSADGAIYYGTDYGYLFSFNADGTKQWEVDTGQPLQRGLAIGPDGTVYGGTEEGYLVAVNGGTAGTPATVREVTGNAGVTGAVVTLEVEPEGTPPFTYAWDFGGGATPNTANGRNPEITLGVPGFYDATVTVGNDHGPAAVQEFTLHVHAAEGPGNGWVRSWGGLDSEYGYGIATGPGGELYISGTTGSFNAVRTDLVLLVYSADGTLQQARTWNYEFYDTARAMTIDATGNIYIVGSVDDGEDSDVLLLKFSPALELLWQKTWDSGRDDVALDVALTATGEVVLAGQTVDAVSDSYAALYLVYSAAGMLTKSSTWDDGGTDRLYSIAVDPTGFISVSGSTEDPIDGNDDALLIRIAADHSMSWIRSCDADDYEWMSFVTVDSAGSSYLAMPYGLVAAFDPTGNLIWSNRWSEELTFVPTDITLSGTNLIMAGSVRPEDRNDDAALVLGDTSGAAATGFRLRAVYDQEGLTAVIADSLADVSCVGYGQSALGTWVDFNVAAVAATCNITTPPGSGSAIVGIASDISGTLVEVVGVENTGGGEDDFVVLRRSLED